MIDPWEDQDLSVDQKYFIALEAIKFKNMYIQQLEDKLRRAETDLLLIRSQHAIQKENR